LPICTIPGVWLAPLGAAGPQYRSGRSAPPI
jgi:hypothetical protein